MDISTIGSVSDSGTTSQLAGQTMDKQDFLNLLLKQLSLQDPLNPMDSTEFTVQLSQFSSLEELTNIGDTLSNVLAFQQSMQNATVTNLIGKDVSVSGNSTYLKDTADINYELSEDASSVIVSVIDSSGSLVRSEEVGPQYAGVQNYIWDGADEFGNQMPEGTYTFEVEALDAEGGPVETITSASGTVTGVFFDDNMTYLVLDGGRNVHLNDIKTIEERRI